MLLANELGRDPYSDEIFAFRSKLMDRLKLLHFDGSGTVMATNWLEAEKFFWSLVTGGVIMLTSA